MSKGAGPIRITFNTPPDGFPARTCDTRVEVNGVEITGIQKLVLIAEPHSVWRAELHFNPILNDETVAAIEGIILERSTLEDQAPKKPRRL